MRERCSVKSVPVIKFARCGNRESDSSKRCYVRISFPSSATPTVSVAMFSPIGFREFSEDDYRKFIRTLSDEELITAGNRLRIQRGERGLGLVFFKYVCIPQVNGRACLV
jgi:hypothetical protein